MKKIDKVLAVNYYYPPIKAIATRRNVNILNELIELFKIENVKIISTNNKFLPIDDTIDTKYTATRVFTIDFFTLQYLRGRFVNFNKKKERYANGNPNALANESSSKLTRFKNTLLGILILGEGGVIYILLAFFKSMRFVNRNTIIITSFSPFSDILTGWLLKIVFPKAFWIADFRDLYIQNNGDNIYGIQFHKRILRTILKKADIVTTVSEGLASSLETFSPNVRVIRNGININRISIKNHKKIDKFSISYTGSLYGYKRDPTLIISAISHLIGLGDIDENDIELNYAGGDHQVWDKIINDFQLNKFNINHKIISREQAIKLQINSQINVVITWCDKDNKGILTGKFFEYIEAGNPILLLIHGERDYEFEKIVRQTNIGTCFYDNETNLMECWISEKYKEWKINGFVSCQYNWDSLKSLTWESQVGSQIQMLINNNP